MKAAVRQEVLAARSRLSAEQRRGLSGEIGSRLFGLPEFRSASTVMFFASFRDEVDTHPMIRRALAMGKRVVLPKVQGRELKLFAISDFDRDVHAGAWGIPEPDGPGARPAEAADIELIVVPGAAFDRRGNRIGYGAGFYDKLLASYAGMTVAVAFELQVLDRAPADPHDVPVKKIVTEARVIDATA